MMVSVLLTWVLLIQLILSNTSYDNYRLKRAVYDIIPKYEYNAVRNNQERRPTRKTIQGTFNLTEYSLNTKKYIEGKLEKRKKYLQNVKFQETKFDKWKEKGQHFTPMMESGHGVKKENILLLCLVIIMNRNISN